MKDGLLSGERLDDLQRDGLMLIQNPKWFCFGMDAVLLSSFACVPEGKKVLDLGCGNGIIPILLSAKTQAEHIEGLEIQADIADMARRSVEDNKLDSRVHITTGDIKEAAEIFGAASFDAVTTNPPYMSESHGLTNPTGHKAIARHELKCTLEDVLKASAKLLKPGGHFFMVHRPSTHEMSQLPQAYTETIIRTDNCTHRKYPYRRDSLPLQQLRIHSPAPAQGERTG